MPQAEVSFDLDANGIFEFICRFARTKPDVSKEATDQLRGHLIGEDGRGIIGSNVFTIDMLMNDDKVYKLLRNTWIGREVAKAFAEKYYSRFFGSRLSPEIIRPERYVTK